MKWQEMTYPCSSSADGNLFSVREEIKRSNKKRYSEIPHAFSEEAKLVTYLSFFFLNTEARPNKIWYKEGLISLQGTLVEKHWEISFISALSGLPAVKQQQARSASNHHHPAQQNPSVHTRARITHQHLWLDVMILFVIRCELGLMMTEVTVVCF